MGAAVEYLRQLGPAWGRGEPVGVYSVCTGDLFAIRAALRQAKEDGVPALVEATSNQVNQFGGYTGMRPHQFVRFVVDAAREAGLSEGQLILGGDHLGPNPWRGLMADEAMNNAAQLVAAFVEAGFTKLHLDASMPLGGEIAAGEEFEKKVAERTAVLCEVAEAAYRERARSCPAAEPPVYVIGSDVPPPGGRAAGYGRQPLTQPEQLQRTLELARAAFHERGLRDAWERVIAVVVHSGAEFEGWEVHDYDRAAAAGLSEALRRHGGLVFEAHSTDYQTPDRLRQMVEDGFCILKVGPALTFAKREALFQLSCIEEELLYGNGRHRRSGLKAALEAAMMAQPEHWRPYYRGTDAQLRLLRKYSLLDRCRYYWQEPAVRSAVNRLLHNLRELGVPLPLLSQYMPSQYARVRAGLLRNDPEELVVDRIRDVLRGYAAAVRSPC